MRWISIVCCVLSFLLFLGWRSTHVEVFSPATLALLKPGMTTNEVKAILGPPSSVDSNHKEYILWAYNRTLLYNVGLVFFDGSGHLKQAFND